MATDTSYSLVMVGRFPGKDRAVAQALVREFGRDDAWGIQVVLNAPIVLFEGLAADQAPLLHAALAEVEAAGCKLEVRHGPEAVDGLSKISWPAPPRIHGRTLAEIFASAQSTATLIVPCPYTGQKMKITLSIQASRVTVEGVAAVHPHAPVHAPVPLPPTPIPVPTVPAARPSGRPQSGAQVQPHAHAPAAAVPLSVPVPMPSPVSSGSRQPVPVVEAPQIIGLESLDELMPMEQFPAESAPQAPRSPVRGNTVMPRSGVPLPDVPVLGNPAPIRPADLPNVEPLPPPAALPSEAPMDMDVFERRVSSSGAYQRPLNIQDEEPLEEEELCSVFIGKTSNARAHQLLAEVQGIGVIDAAKLCQRPIITIAKDIPLSEAQQLKQEFAAVNVTARINRKKQA